MLYIKDFFILFKGQLLRGLFFISLTIFLIVAFSAKSQLEKHVQGLTRSEIESPYILGVVEEKINVNLLQRRLTGLPSIEKIEVKKNISINNVSSKFLKSYSDSLPSELLNKSYNSIKIFFTERSTNRKRNLIRDYIYRMVGESNINLTNIVDKKYYEKKRTVLLSQIKSKSVPLGLSLLCAFWILSLYLNKKEITKKLYILNQFRRGSSVGRKTIFWGFGFLLISSNLISGLFFGLDYITYLFSLGMLLITSFVMSDEKWSI